MYKLYIANKNFSSWSLRAWVLMRGLRIDFEEQLVPFVDGGSWNRFREFSPTGKVPCLRDGEILVWESLSIAEYVAERHPGVWPDSVPARAWARSAASEMHAGFMTLRDHCPMTVGQRIKLHERPKPLLTDLKRLAELWNTGLETFGGPFLAGERFTAVDAFFAPVVFRCQTYDLALDGAAADYPTHLLAQSAMQEWQAAALCEPHREPLHEQDIATRGVCVEDLRTDPPDSAG